MATATKTKKAPKKDTMQSRRQRSVVESNVAARQRSIADEATTPQVGSKPTDPGIITLLAIDVKEFSIPINGTSALIVNKFSNKARTAIKEKQEQKAKGARAKRDPHAEYLEAMYVMPGTGKPGSKSAKYGVPAAGFKNAAISSCRYIEGMAMTFAKGAFHVMEDAGGLLQIKHDKNSPHMREDAVRLAGVGSPLDLRYRPEFTNWSCILRVKYNARAISPEQIVNMFNVAGFHIGVCEMRPEKGYQNGMFEVVTGKGK